MGSGNVTIPQATTVTKGAGGTAGLFSTITVQDPVLTSLGKVGPGVQGTVQEYIPIVVYAASGTSEPFQTTWTPNAAGTAFNLSNGSIFDTINPGDPIGDWALTANGAVYCLWSQQLRITWIITGPSGNTQEESILTTLSWTVTKVNPYEWSLA
jgi:hypothetical protein